MRSFPFKFFFKIIFDNIFILVKDKFIFRDLSIFNNISLNGRIAIIQWTTPFYSKRASGHVNNANIGWSSWYKRWITNLYKGGFVRKVSNTSIILCCNTELMVRSLRQTGRSIVKIRDLNPLIDSDPFLTTLFSSFDNIVEDIISTIFFRSCPLESDLIFCGSDLNRSARGTWGGESVFGDDRG